MVDPTLRIIYYKLKRQLALAREKQKLMKEGNVLNNKVPDSQEELDQTIQHLELQIELLK